MDVHHHPNAGKKGFKEYFLEFLMIFLAVTLGFFAENIREHFVEKANEKKYMRSLLEDLKRDSASFKNVIEYNDADIKNIDSAVVMLNSPLITDSIGRFLYYSNTMNYYFKTLVFSQRTISQLKSAGGFKLITRQDVSDKIVDYDNTIAWIAWLREELMNSLKDSRASAFYIFNDYLTRQYDPTNAINLLHSSNKYQLLTTDKKALIPYANKLNMRMLWLASYNGNLEVMQTKCNELIRLTKKAYHLQGL